MLKNNKIKIIVVLIILFAVAIGIVVLINNKSKNVKGTLEEIMAKVYSGIPEEELPKLLENIEVNKENIEMFLGTNQIKYREALASETIIGSIAHSVVLVRLENIEDVELTIEKIENSVNPRKWICVEAESVIVKNKGNLIILIMSNEEMVQKLEENFNNL
ncbi:MAG: hypothetical protein E7310_09150 [Clostridiales bacterium]|nr:hypothetical protein [Clostridiales bacterium]